MEEGPPERIGKLEIRQGNRSRVMGAQRNTFVGIEEADGGLGIGRRPVIPKPELGNTVKFGGGGAPGYPFLTNAEGVGGGFGIFDEDVEVAVLVKNSCVEQFILECPVHAVLVYEFYIRELALRILVKHPHVTMCRSVVEVKPVLLYIFAVISFLVGKAKHPLLQNGITTIPEGKAKDQQLISVTNSRDGVFTPPVRLAARHVVAEIVPGLSIGAVVCADRSPGALTDVGPPFSPGLDGT